MVTEQLSETSVKRARHDDESTSSDGSEDIESF